LVKRAFLVTLSMLFATPAFAADPPEQPKAAAPAGDVTRLTVAGNPDAFYVEPFAPDEQPLILVLHPRHGDAEADCAKWAEVAGRHGWVLCPAGPIGTDGDRSWGKFDDAKQVIDGAVAALRAKFGARVRARDNLLIGFSEGALMGQILGLTEADQWSRWLILAGSNTYWGDDDDRALTWLRSARRKIARVVMLTGEYDPIVENTLRAGALVRAAHIPVRVIVRRGMGHEVPEARMTANYDASLRWLFELP
jgi:predicted esterase